MDSNAGGQSSLTPEVRRRQTATEIARRKVMAAYGGSVFEQETPKEQPVEVKQETQPVQAAPVVNTQPTNPAVSQQTWQRYHAAWQEYYQKYYSEYYARAAHQYIQTERLKNDRAANDERRLLSDTHMAIVDDAHANEVGQSLKARIQAKAAGSLKKSRRHRHLMPILAGVAVVLVILFLQYNRLIFAPIMAYIAPGNTEDTGITAIDPTATVAPTADPRLIIPKLNVDVPVAFGISNDDTTVNEAMNHGVAHFMVPGANAFPGQVGNTVITGHSAGDIYSSNPYKFIFSGLERLVAGDMIYVNYQSVRYTYTVTKLETVEPSNVAALIYPTNKPMLTLITCTPLGTSRYRLLVTAEQVNPAPDGNAEAISSTPTEATVTEVMPANEPSFLENLWNWLTGN